VAAVKTRDHYYAIVNPEGWLVPETVRNTEDESARAIVYGRAKDDLPLLGWNMLKQLGYSVIEVEVWVMPGDDGRGRAAGGR
jgi:hypothetical protein